MDSLSRTAYLDAFSNDPPATVGKLLSNRLGAAGEVNERLAEYFAERAEIEEAYAQSLQRAINKLQHRPFTSSSALSKASARALERATTIESAEIVRMHESFARRCRNDLEVPLRNRSGKEDWQRVVRLEKGNEDVLRDMEDAEKQVHKNQSKSSRKQDKISSSISALSEVESAYASRLPNYLSSYQQLDYARLTSIKEILTSFETLQNDLGRERMELAERGLEKILGWEIELELSEWLSSEGFKGGRNLASSNTNNNNNSHQAPEGATTPSTAVESPNSDLQAPAPSFSNGPSGRPRAGTHDNQSVRSGNNGFGGRAMSTASTEGSGAAPKSEKKKKGGFLSALKVGKLDRRKSTMGHHGSSGSPARPGGSQALRDNDDDSDDASSMVSGARDSRDRQQGPSMRSTGPSDDFGNDSSLRPSATTRRSNRDSFMPSFMKKRGTSANDVSSNHRNETIREDVSSPSNNNFGADEFGSRARSGSGFDAQTPATTDSRSNNPFNTYNNAPSHATPTFGHDGSDAAATAPATGAHAARSSDRNGIVVDDQGYSIPPSNYTQPASGDLMSMDDSGDENEQPAAMKVNIAPIASPAAPVHKENDEESQAALMRMKNTLLAQSAPSPAGSVNRRATRLGGRGSRQSTIGTTGSGSGSGGAPTTGFANLSSTAPPIDSPSDDIPIGTILEMNRQQGKGVAGVADNAPIASPTEMLASPPLSPTSGFARQFNTNTGSKAGSVLSTSSSQQNLAQVASNPFQTAGSSSTVQATSGGLRASILETVNVLFKAGSIVRVLITGEISLSSKNFDFASIDTGDDLVIRIEQFEKLEKFAPNNAILTPANGDSSGEYALNTAALQSAKDGINTIFKYQLRTEGDLAHYVPVDINPQWKLDTAQKQISFLMTYHGNPSCVLNQVTSDDPFGSDEPTGATPTSTSTLLQDVYFNVPIPSNLSGSSVKNLQTKPTGSYSVEKKRIIWKMDNMDANEGRTAKILARFTSDDLTQDGPPHEIQPVVIHWRLPGRLASGLNVELFTRDGRGFDDVIRQTISGKYLASP